MQNVAMAILQQLEAWGVKSIYGVVGDDIFYLLDALAQQEGIKFIQVKHEESAALMASAHAKLTGELGVCLADGGPGTLHLLNGLADASQDGVPVLAITGQVSRKDMGTNAKQYIDQQSLMRPLVSYTSLISEPAATIPVLEMALRNALCSRSVAHLSVPRDVLKEKVSATVVPFGPYLTTAPLSYPEVIYGASKLLNNAQRPIILVGEGGRHARDAIAQFAAEWGAAIATTLAGTGVVDYNNPLYIGGLGHAGSKAVTNLLAQADMCFIVGANWWPGDSVPEDIPIVQLDVNPANIGATTPVSYGIVGQAEQVIPQLQLDNSSDKKEWLDKITQENTKWKEILDEEAAISTAPMHPAAVIRTIEEHIPNDAIISLDTGDHTIWFGRGFRPRQQRVVFSGKWRTMGFGVPAAIAAKLANPEKQVVAIVGDGGFTMTMAEMLTAVKYQLPITVVILNNSCLAMEKNKMKAGGLAPKGTELHNPDFAAYGLACGCQGFKAESKQELARVLQASLTSAIPSVIDVLTSEIEVPGTTMPS